MKIYIKKKNIINKYVWRPHFCWYPVQAKDFFGGENVLVWLGWVWRQGPFTQEGTNKKKYEYKLDPPYPDLYRFHITGGTKEYKKILDSLIDGPDLLHKKLLEEIDYNKKFKAHLQVLQNLKKRMDDKERDKITNYRRCPKPFEEGSGMAPIE